jgi:hypothetical protein
MIQTETMTINGKAFIRTYSDSGRYVVRDGVEYPEAIDLAYLNRIYTESENMLPDIPAEEALAILTGGDGV